jgi:linoleoyl-CoA desaturase
LPDSNGNIKNSWAIHQLNTTVNFAAKSKLVNWFTGGLNYQVEHHLFPNICHVHYPAISKIVKATAQEYGIPYHCQKTFGSALKSHYAQLKELGRSDSLPVTSTLVYT